VCIRDKKDKDAGEGIVRHYIGGWYRGVKENSFP